jgi:protein involved in polysaccharide export with SLBB domain
MNVSKWAGRFGAIWGLLLAGIFLAGCQTGPSGTRFSEVPGGPSKAANGSPADSAVTPTSGSATLGESVNSINRPLKVGDLVKITLLDLPINPVPFDGRIREDGTVTLILNQTFTAAGKTPGALEKEIRDAYVPKKFKYMTVMVNLQEGSRFYYVDGEVKTPGQKPYVARIKLLEAIASAGGFSDFARKSKVRLTRTEGQKMTMIIDCQKAKTHPELNIEILPNDRIDVPKSPL